MSIKVHIFLTAKKKNNVSIRFSVRNVLLEKAFDQVYRSVI